MATAPQSVPAKSPTPSELPPVQIPGEIIPPAVREGASLADRLQAEHIARIKGELPPEPTPTPPQEPQETPPTPTPTPTPTPAPTPPQEPQPEQLPQPATAGTEAAKWEHAYKSAKGRFNADLARLQAMIDEQAAEIRRLNSLSPQNPAVNPAKPTQPTVTPAGPLDLAAAGITQEDVETFGPELFNAIEKVAGAKAEAMVASLRAELAPKVDQVATSVQADGEARMANMLNQQLAADTGGQLDFDQLNVDQNFCAWLDLPDPISGVKRSDLLVKAWNSLDGSRVLAISRAYLGDLARATPAPVVDPKTLPAGGQNPAQAPKIPLASLAAPGRARTPAPANGPVNDKPIYTRAEVKAFYTAKQRGFYSPEDALKWEREIIAAGNEGRIQG